MLQIKLSQVGFSDFGEEFDDILSENGDYELFPIKTDEIPKIEFDHVCQRYYNQAIQKDNNRRGSTASSFTDEYRKAFLQLFRTAAQNPKIFMKCFLDSNYELLKPFKKNMYEQS
ncbi:MAG: hypothetical protein EZS28_007915 [Streblomastix strix]|uniref:Uncharacterized protein n=1 Tax=Streblomastix strix TaxID=222440 RepID=A0A5J4WPE9_9EUKA|nr:MAG: hypothetical protein EZS28_007915 [Streblomastix strix]